MAREETMELGLESAVGEEVSKAVFEAVLGARLRILETGSLYQIGNFIIALILEREFEYE